VPVIKAAHLLIYSDDAEATRAFLRDVLGWPFVVDPGSVPDWPIFRVGPSELGVHPTSSEWDGKTWTSPRHHSISLMCDDIEAEKAALEAKGAAFSGEISDMGFGQAIMMKVPGADDVMLYQPSHPEGHSLPD
jgi:catechol 2,3-dioxygenase-like lactoylglutathione lyase family enzyme